LSAAFAGPELTKNLPERENRWCTVPPDMESRGYGRRLV
jgi:hypothetical protein